MLFDVMLALDVVGGLGSYDKDRDHFYIPWDIPEDMQLFKSITTYTENPFKKNVVIMGYNTWISLPAKFKPLPSRINIVITRKTIDGVDTYTSFDNALSALKADKYDFYNIFVIGGAMLYEEALRHPRLRHIFLTTIDKDTGCNIKLSLDVSKYKLLNQSKVSAYGFNITFSKYDASHEEWQYLNIMKNILEKGSIKDPRNQICNVTSIFGEKMVFDLSNNTLPILTTKQVYIKTLFEELMFFLKGDTNNKHLKDKNVKIWNGNTNKEFLEANNITHLKEDDLGPMYGFQWRHFNAEYNGCDYDYKEKGFDQLEFLVNGLIKNRSSRRLLMTTYNPGQVHLGVLPPCHGITIQFNVLNDNELHCQMYQRSADFFIGVPFNITSYGLLIYIIAELVNNSDQYTGPKLIPKKLIMILGDTHLYNLHLDAAAKQLERDPYPFPTIEFNKKIKTLDDLNTFEWKDIKISNYKYHPNDFGVQMIA